MDLTLDPEARANLATLRLRVRATMEGVLSGLHRSPHQGQSVEFAEHKEYAPGDEIRHLDWKAYGKLDKYYVKRFEHETNLRAYLVVDASASMAYASAPASKLTHASIAAAALAFLLVRQQDAAGLCLARGDDVRFLPPRASPAHATAILDLLGQTDARGPTRLSSAADLLSEKARRRALVLLFSDLLDGGDGLAKFLQLRALGHEVAVFHVLDPAELTFPFEDPTLFLSMEDDRRIEANPLALREGYLEEMGRFLDEARRRCRAAGCDYELLRTDEPPDRALLRFLLRRDRRWTGEAVAREHPGAG